MRRIIVTMALGVTSAALIACGSSQPAPRTVQPAESAPPPRPAGPVSASGSEAATETVGAAGGTFSLTNGARLAIPAGAIAEETEVTFGIGAPGQAFGGGIHQRPLGPVLRVEPALFSEGAPFSVSIPRQAIPSEFEEADLAFAMEEIGQQRGAMDSLATRTEWQFYPVRVEGERFVAEVAGLPGHRVQFGVAR